MIYLKNGVQILIPVSFGGSADNPDIYSNCASEMMFELPIKDMYIPKNYCRRRLLKI